MDSSDLFMPHNNDDNGDGGDAHGSGGVHAFEPLFCPHPPHHTCVHALSTPRPAALQGRDRSQNYMNVPKKKNEK